MIRQLRKNRGRRGASLLIAILVFFLAALSGTVALTMAESNAGRYTHEKEDQQAYLAVASASKLILDELGKVQVRFTGNGTDVPELPSDVGAPTFYKKGSDTEKIDDLKLFFKDKEFIDQLKTILPYGKQEGEPAAGTALETEGYKPVSFTLTVEGNEKSAVLVELDLHEPTQLYIRLWYAENGNSSYQMTVTVGLGSDKEEGEGGGESGSGAQWETSEDGEGVRTYYVDLSWRTEDATYTYESEFSEEKPAVEEPKEGEEGTV